MTDDTRNNDKKEKVAIALEYERDTDPAPKIVATGKNELAEKIIAIAKEHGVEVRQDRELAEILSVLEVDSLIPFEAYASVAEILSYIYRKNREKMDGDSEKN
ncbi:MAG: flagellar biosynthesis protein FlhB [Alphaproteobacteria bacterium CG11_big_fil_rev_8_21_14_0_20_44_7]|nr:MAG: flagellar biosynthesis protein FlhB [Alphaproteobacteria bacterium CG11_big_fil_rev_8_21_14_0_20_44_7]